jgi:hypothetical protein
VVAVVDDEWTPALAGALLVGLWAGAALVDPPTPGGAVVALAAVALAHRRRPAAALGVAALAVAVAPVDEARPSAALLAAAAVLVATAVSPWLALAAVPGVAVLATALADVPAAGDPPAWTHVAFAVALAAAAARFRPAPAGGHVEPEAGVAAALLGAWLLAAPSTWGWAVGDAEALEAWDRAAAVALVAGVLAAVADRGLEGVRK